MKKEKKIEQYERKAVMAYLKQFDILQGSDGNVMEVTMWHNGDGFDVEVMGTQPERFSLTFGEFDALKKLVKMF
jgi:hypothetical protein